MYSKFEYVYDKVRIYRTGFSFELCRPSGDGTVITPVFFANSWRERRWGPLGACLRAQPFARCHRFDLGSGLPSDPSSRPNRLEATNPPFSHKIPRPVASSLPKAATVILRPASSPRTNCLVACSLCHSNPPSAATRFTPPKTHALSLLDGAFEQRIFFFSFDTRATRAHS